MSETLVTQAILLRSVATGEADRVVTLLGRSTGKVAALARGARKSTRRFGGGLGLGATGEATVRDRPGAELAWLEAFEVSQGRHGLGSDLGSTAHAGYVSELCDQLCAPRQPEPEVYDRLLGFLDALDARGPHAARLRAFEAGLLGSLGFGIGFDACVACGRRDLDETVRLDTIRGGVTCPACARGGSPLSPQVRTALDRFGRMTLAEAEAMDLPREINAACRNALGELLALHLTRPLKSLEFLRKLQGH